MILTLAWQVLNPWSHLSCNRPSTGKAWYYRCLLYPEQRLFCLGKQKDMGYVSYKGVLKGTLRTIAAVTSPAPDEPHASIHSVSTAWYRHYCLWQWHARTVQPPMRGNANTCHSGECRRQSKGYPKSSFGGRGTEWKACDTERCQAVCKGIVLKNTRFLPQKSSIGWSLKNNHRGDSEQDNGGSEAALWNVLKTLGTRNSFKTQK